MSRGSWLSRERRWSRTRGAGASCTASRSRSSESGNSEVLSAWLEKSLDARYKGAYPAIERFLTTQGRRKFLKPLYEDLMAAAPWGPAEARRLYQRARPTYHAVAVSTLDGIVR